MRATIKELGFVLFFLIIIALVAVEAAEAADNPACTEQAEAN